MGRLEVKYRGNWGTVCDDDFSSNNAKVACRQVGYPWYLIFNNYTCIFYMSYISIRKQNLNRVIYE